MIDQSQVSIIIPHISLSRETEFSLKECLQSLIETTSNCKIIVVTNGSKPMNGYKWNNLNPIYDRVKRIHVEEQGQCKSVNAAIATVNTPWVFVTNNDMVYAPGWWEKMTNDLREDILCISPMLVEPRPGAPTFLVEFCGGAGGDFDKQKWLDYAAKQNFPLYLRLAALLHDVGKPKSRAWKPTPKGTRLNKGEKGEWTFYQHQ